MPKQQTDATPPDLSFTQVTLINSDAAAMTFDVKNIVVPPDPITGFVSPGLAGNSALDLYQGYVDLPLDSDWLATVFAVEFLFKPSAAFLAASLYLMRSFGSWDGFFLQFSPGQSSVSFGKENIDDQLIAAPQWEAGVTYKLKFVQNRDEATPTTVDLYVDDALFASSIVETSEYLPWANGLRIRSGLGSVIDDLKIYSDEVLVHHWDFEGDYLDKAGTAHGVFTEDFTFPPSNGKLKLINSGDTGVAVFETDVLLATTELITPVAHITDAYITNFVGVLNTPGGITNPGNYLQEGDNPQLTVRTSGLDNFKSALLGVSRSLNYGSAALAFSCVEMGVGWQLGLKPTQDSLTLESSYSGLDPLTVQYGTDNLGFNNIPEPKSKAEFGGSFARKTEIVSADTLLDQTYFRVIANAECEITLADATTCVGREYSIVHSGAGGVAILAAAAVEDKLAVATLDDLSYGPVYTAVGQKTYLVEITAADGVNPDQFRVYEDTILIASDVAITGAAQVLANGFTVTFANTIGHAIGDYWQFAVRKVTINGADTFPLATQWDKATVVSDGENWVVVG